MPPGTCTGRERGIGIMARLGKLIGDRRGASAVEYSLILALIVLAMIAGLRIFANTTIGMWNTVSDNVLNNA